MRKPSARSAAFAFCPHCRRPCPKGDDAPSKCPECGRAPAEPRRFRFSLKVLLVLGVLCLGVIGMVASARSRRAGAAPSAEAQTDSTWTAPAEPSGRSRVGAVPCGYCNGDGRLDDADLNRRDPPRINAPPGPCPACGGRGGIGK